MVCAGKPVRLAVSADPGWDAAAAARTRPAPLGELAERLGLGPRWAALAPFVEPSDAAAPPPPRPAPNQIRCRFFGHAAVLLETESNAVLVDPIIPAAPQAGAPRFLFADLPERIDLALITHGHPDHLHLETLLQLRGRVDRIVVPQTGIGRLEDPNLRLMLKAAGFPRVEEMGALDEIGLDDGCVTGLAFTGEHSDMDIQAKLAYHVRLHDRSFLLAADCANTDSAILDRLFEAVGAVDTLFIGMESGGAPLSWLYGPLITAPLEREQDSARRLSGADVERARDMCERLRAREVFFYAMGEEPWMWPLTGHHPAPARGSDTPSDRLAQSLRARGVAAAHLVGPQTFHYPGATGLRR